MTDYNPTTALEELNEESVLPHPVRVRDMMIRAELSPEQALELNRKFQNYLHAYGDLQVLGKSILEELAGTRQRS